MFNNAWNEEGYLKMSAFLKFLSFLFLLYLFAFYIIPEAYDAIRPKPFRFEDLKTTDDMYEFLEKRYIGKNIDEVIPELKKVGVSYFRKYKPDGQKSYNADRSILARYGINTFSEYQERYSEDYYGDYRHNYFRPGWKQIGTEYEFSLLLDKRGLVFGIWARRRDIADLFV